MIVIDNCILSSLAKIERLDILKNFNDIATTVGVIEEIFRSEIDEIIEPVSSITNKWLIIVSSRDYSGILDIQKSNMKLSFVDCELIKVCKEKSASLFSDDTRLIDIAGNEFDIKVYDLFDILMALKKQDRLSQEEMNEIIIQLRKKDHYSFSKISLKQLKDNW